MVERQGRIWDLGAPYLAGSNNSGLDQGVVYQFPESAKLEESKKWESLFKDNQEELGDHLVKKLRNYMKEFKISGIGPGIPYFQTGRMDGAILHMGGNGQWIEACPTFGSGCLAFHNLDGYPEPFAGFNIGSDALEYLDETLLCPRISVEEEKYKITYPLPEGKSLPLEEVSALTDPEMFNRWFNVGKLGKVKLTTPFGYEFESGKIYLTDNSINAEVDDGWKVWGTTFIMGRLLDSFVFGRS